METYRDVVQFYDVLSEHQHAATDARIASALAGIETEGYPILDIGAGTGLTTRVIAETILGVDIMAFEPSAAMRGALMTRICADPDLRRRVTIMPFPILGGPLPDRISAAVAGASLVHFSASTRKRLWSLLASRLAPAGRIVMELLPLPATDLPDTKLAEARIGHVRYEGWASVRKVSATRQRWRMTYVAILDGHEIDRRTANFTCWSVSATTLLREASRAGLSGSIQENIAVLQPANREA